MRGEVRGRAAGGRAWGGGGASSAQRDEGLSKT